LRPPPPTKNPPACFIETKQQTLIHKERMDKMIPNKIIWVRGVVLLVGLAVLGTACLPAAVAPGPMPLNVMVHDSFAVSKEVVAEFEMQNNAKLNFIQSGDAGALVNRAILSRNAPIADVLYGVDNTFLSRALEAAIFDPYLSPALAQIPTVLQLDASHQVSPVDTGDVCINIDKGYFSSKALAVPQSLEDLLKPEYKGLLVVENPATSSPGLAFLLATIAHFGTDHYLEYWKSLQANGVVVVNDWETAYYTSFSGSSGQGAQPMVVSYGSSPAAEVVFSKQKLLDSPTASLVGPDTCFRQVEFVGILKGAHQRVLAEKFVDFMLSVRFQEDMPLQMFVYPANPQAKLPDEFIRYAQAPAAPASLPAAEIAKNRDAWVQAWKDAVLK
jgi:thiamine transport system substrate-binding protein